MKQILIPMFLWQSTIFANTITLDDLIINAKEPKLIEKALKEEIFAGRAKSQADTADNPFVVNHSLSRISSPSDVSGYGFDIGLSQEIKLGNIQSLEREQRQLIIEANVIEQKKTLLSLENRLKNLYHQHCLEGEYISSFENYYTNLLELYHKKERAYKFDEISKKELLQLQLEVEQQQRELENLQTQQNRSQKLLLSLTTLGKENALFCQDLLPLQASLFMDKEHLFSLTQEAYDKRIKSTQKGLERYSKKIESIEVSLKYSKEVRTDFYTIGIAVPLNFTSNKSEQERSALMHQSSAIESRKEQTLQRKHYQINALRNKLENLYAQIANIEQSLDAYQNQLLPMMQKSYNYGESSIIEYLLSQQKVTQLQQALLKKKKEYYQVLFQIYTTQESKS